MIGERTTAPSAAPRTTAAPRCAAPQRRCRRSAGRRSTRPSRRRCGPCCRARRRRPATTCSAGGARRGGLAGSGGRGDMGRRDDRARASVQTERQDLQPAGLGGPVGAAAGVDSRASSTNRQNAFASRIWSGVRARTRHRSGDPTTTATHRARDVATLSRLPAVQEVHPARRELRVRRRQRVDADRRLLALELVDRADAGLRRAAEPRDRADLGVVRRDDEDVAPSRAGA